MNYEIENESSQNEVVKYVYEHKSQLINKLSNVIVKRSRCGEESTCIGFGEYDFKFGDSLIHIKYNEEATPKSGHDRIKYFKRMILSCQDGEESIIEFMKDLKEKTTGNLLNIYVTDEYGNWSLYNKIEHRKIDTIYKKILKHL